LTFQWFFGRLLDERDFQLHLDGLAGSRKQRRFVKEKISSNPETFGNHKMTF